MVFPDPEIVARIEAAGPSWFPELRQPARARVREAHVRPQSALAIVEFSDDATGRAVVVKMPFPSGHPSLPPRPRLGLDTGFDEKHATEWRALVAAWDELASTRDGVGAVRPLEHVEEAGILVIEHVRATPLRSHLREPIAAAHCRRAGRWLAIFQQAPGLASLPVRRSQASESAAMCERFASHLATPLARRLAARAAEILEEVEPQLGAGHGDYAPRNVLVEGDVVRAIDPLGMWRVPVLEDVAFFTVQLAVGARPGGSGRRSALRAAFLEGHGTPDDRRLWATEALVLLDMWAATARPASPASARGEVVRRVRHHRVRRSADALARRLDAA